MTPAIPPPSIFDRCRRRRRRSTTSCAAMKDCGKHCDDDRHFFRRRHLVYLIAGMAAASLITILIVFLVLRPEKPQFFLQDATVQQLDASNVTDLISTSFQVTVQSRNPNSKAGVYYDQLDVYASYNDQKITLPTVLPPVYLDNGAEEVWSPVIAGRDVLLAPYLADAIREDCAAGYLILSVMVDGVVKWKVGSFTSGSYRLSVSCPALLVAGDGGSTAGLKFQQTAECIVDV